MLAVGAYGDGPHSAPLAEYADPGRAEDARLVVGNGTAGRGAVALSN